MHKNCDAKSSFFMTLIVCYGSIDITRLYLKAKNKSQINNNLKLNSNPPFKIPFSKPFLSSLKRLSGWKFSHFTIVRLGTQCLKATNMSDKEKSLFAYKLVEKP